jgi:hypothetical protein
VRGDLYCYNNRLKELPANLKIRGLDCSSNQLKELPTNLKVGGSLDCSHNRLKELPTNLKVGGLLYFFKNIMMNSKDIPYINRILKGKIKKEEFLAEENAEIKRVIVENMGQERFFKMFDLVKIGDPVIKSSIKGIIGGQLFRTKEKDPIIDDYIYFVKVYDSSTNRRYYNCIPPERATSVRDAIAWRWGKEEKEYMPKIET